MGLPQNARRRLLGLLLVLTLGYLAAAVRMPIGNFSSPGPGFFPVVVGVLVAALSGALLLQAEPRSGPGTAPAVFPSGAAATRVVGVWLAVAAYAALVSTLGHALLATLVSVAILRVLGMRRWRDALLLAALLAGGSYLAFTLLLGVPLPDGIWAP